VSVIWEKLVCAKKTDNTKTNAALKQNNLPVFVCFPFADFSKMRPFRKVENSIIFICLTPNLKCKNLKIIEFRSLPFEAFLPNRQG
jgi:hypothetical protein